MGTHIILAITWSLESLSKHKNYPISFPVSNSREEPACSLLCWGRISVLTHTHTHNLYFPNVGDTWYYLPWSANEACMHLSFLISGGTQMSSACSSRRTRVSLSCSGNVVTFTTSVRGHTSSSTRWGMFEALAIQGGKAKWELIICNKNKTIKENGIKLTLCSNVVGVTWNW